jgi:hypothetical protein
VILPDSGKEANPMRFRQNLTKLFLALSQPMFIPFVCKRKSNLQVHFPPGVALGRWEDTLEREKYWYVVTVSLPVENLYLHSPVEKTWFRLTESPQSDFYNQLAEGIDPEATRWFSRVGGKYRDKNRFFSKKLRILELAKTSVDMQIPVFLAGPKRALVVDGTHRAAALTSLGAKTIRCQVLVWYWKPKRKKR